MRKLVGGKEDTENLVQSEFIFALLDGQMFRLFHLFEMITLEDFKEGENKKGLCCTEFVQQSFGGFDRKPVCGNAIKEHQPVHRVNLFSTFSFPPKTFSKWIIE